MIISGALMIAPHVGHRLPHESLELRFVDLRRAHRRLLVCHCTTVGVEPACTATQTTVGTGVSTAVSVSSQRCPGGRPQDPCAAYCARRNASEGPARSTGPAPAPTSRSPSRTASPVSRRANARGLQRRMPQRELGRQQRRVRTARAVCSPVALALPVDLDRLLGVVGCEGKGRPPAGDDRRWITTTRGPGRREQLCGARSSASRVSELWLGLAALPRLSPRKALEPHAGFGVITLARGRICSIKRILRVGVEAAARPDSATITGSTTMGIGSGNSSQRLGHGRARTRRRRASRP